MDHSATFAPHSVQHSTPPIVKSPESPCRTCNRWRRPDRRRCRTDRPGRHRPTRCENVPSSSCAGQTSGVPMPGGSTARRCQHRTRREAQGASPQFRRRLVPANAFPFALATCADALHRPLHAIGIVGLSRGGDTLLTDVALLRLWSGIVKPLRAENLPVFDDGFECTVLVVAPTRACGAHKRLFAHPTLPLSRSFVHDNRS